ncbi:MAG: hypothetical protein JW801_11895 [Bacteroidales bacterium]|nr:hypothetical protein [Bacteroidales bacterium]
MSIFVIVLLVALGFVLLMVELLVIPGITIAGIGGVLLIAGGVVSGYAFHPAATGNYIFLGSMAGIILMFVLALKAKTWKRFGLKSEIQGKVGSLEEGKLVPGDEGETVSKLSPIGRALIKDELFEVRSEGGYIDEHKKVRIIRIDGNKIYVELK